MKFRCCVIAVASLCCFNQTAAEEEKTQHVSANAAGSAVESGTLALRRPELPAAQPGSEHPIDRLLRPYFVAHHVPADQIVADRTFARRVFLDLIGLLPSPEQLAGFVQDSAPDKRMRLVRTLLNQRQHYAEHWLTFWNDALRNAYRGTGFIDGGRKQITSWLYLALYTNMPYDQFVRELVTASNGAEGFTKGLIWRGVVNASQRPEMQAAQNLSQVFLATNLKCASCHDSLVNHWKLRDAYALASVFATEPLEMHHCDMPTGEIAPAGYIYPDAGTLDASLSREARVEKLADLLTRPDQGRLAQTIINRLWAVFFGQGIVEPLDDLDAEPFDQDLLGWLAADLIDHRWDLQHSMELICTSRAYQRPATDVEPQSGQRRPTAFRGPLLKRLSAEQFCDAVAMLTGVWPAPSGGMVQPDERLQGGQWAVARAHAPATPAPFPARWIWSNSSASRKAPIGQVAFRITVDLAHSPTSAPLIAASDQGFVLYVNEIEAIRNTDHFYPVKGDIASLLRPGRNVLAVVAVNGRGLEPTLDIAPIFKTPLDLIFQRMPADPAGFILSATILRHHDELANVNTDATWRWCVSPARGFQHVDFDASGWKQAAELGDADMEPWRLGRELRIKRNGIRGDISNEQVRAALCDDDALIRALGRPSREQVVTRRETIATMLQALELTSGSLLDERLRGGAERWLARRWPNTDELARQIYLAGLGREPSSAELATTVEVLGNDASVESVQDVLWMLVMFPEFQLIY